MGGDIMTNRNPNDKYRQNSSNYDEIEDAEFRNEPLDSTQPIDASSIRQAEERAKNNRGYNSAGDNYIDGSYQDIETNFEQDTYSEDYQGSSPYVGPNHYDHGHYPPQNNYGGQQDEYRYEPSVYQQGQYRQNEVVSKKAFNPFDFISAIGGLLMILIPILPFASVQSTAGEFVPSGAWSIMRILDLMEIFEGPTSESETIRLVCYIVMGIGALIILLSLIRLRGLNLIISFISGLVLPGFFFYTLINKDTYNADVNFNLGFWLILVAGTILIVSPLVSILTARGKYNKSRMYY